MAELNRPSEELASRITARLTYNERLRLDWNNGESDIPELLYGFEEAVRFLSMEDSKLGRGVGRPCVIDFDALKEWVAAVIGDSELAAAITGILKPEEGKAGPPGPEKVKPVRDLMVQRLEQSREVRKEMLRAGVS